MALNTPSPPTRPSRLRRLLCLPLYLASVLSWDKSFRHKPVIGNRTLNRLGLHLVRLVISHALFAFRLCLLSPLAAATQGRQFKTQGYLLIQDFLSPAAFTALRREVRGYHGEVRAETEGRTLTERVYLTREVLAGLPGCRQLVESPRLLIANVHGIHRRGDAAPGARRLAVWMQARDKPFNPLFTPFPRFTARIFEFVWSRETAARTARQVQTGAWAIRQDGFSLTPEARCGGADEPPPKTSATP